MRLNATDRRRATAVAIGAVARKMKRRFDLRVDKIGVTSAKWTLIAVVSTRPGATQRTIAELLNVTEASAGRLIDRLCADGYLRRSANPQDRRAYRVYLTEAADPLLKELEALARQNEIEAFAGFTDEEVVLAEHLLTRISNNLSEAGPLSERAPDLVEREPEKA
jgi:MarR family transcriptional regulator for hemolysin